MFQVPGFVLNRNNKQETKNKKQETTNPEHYNNVSTICNDTRRNTIFFPLPGF